MTKACGASTPVLLVTFLSILIEILNYDLFGTYFQQGEGVNAAIVRIVRLLARVQPFDIRRRALWRVVGETTVAQAHALNADKTFVGNAKVFMPPNPTEDLSSGQKRLHLA